MRTSSPAESLSIHLHPPSTAGTFKAVSAPALPSLFPLNYSELIFFLFPCSPPGSKERVQSLLEMLLGWFVPESSAASPTSGVTCYTLFSKAKQLQR